MSKKKRRAPKANSENLKAACYQKKSYARGGVIDQQGHYDIDGTTYVDDEGVIVASDNTQIKKHIQSTNKLRNKSQ